MRKVIFTLSILSLIFVPFLSNADGGLVSPPDYYIWENEQQAVIFYEDGVETLAVTMSFQGNAEDFGWIMPTPNQPTVNKASKKLFSNIDDLTYPVYEYDSGWGFKTYSMAEDSAPSSVSVIEQTKVDYYDVTILQATDSNKLTEWLTENGYNYPTEYTYLLNDYIKNEWYFTAIKIDPSVSLDIVEGELIEGSATPLLLKFEAPTPVFPMRLSKISLPDEDYYTALEDYDYYYYDESVYVQLYVISDNKKDIPGFHTTYADTHTKDEIRNLATNEVGEPWIDPQKDEYFITRMYDYVYEEDMDEDIFILDATDSDKVGTNTDTWQDLALNVLAIVAAGLVVAILTLFVLAISPFGLGFIIPAIILFKIKSKGGRALCWVLEACSLFFVVVFILLAVLALVSALSSYFFSSVYPWLAIAVLAVLVIVLVIEVIVMIKQKKHWKKKLSKNN